MIVDCAYYQDGRRQQEAPLELDQASEIRGGPHDGFIWLGMVEPSAQELADVQQRFELHDLPIEDAQTMHRRAKVEQYNRGAFSFIVVQTVRFVREAADLDFGEVSMFVGRDFIIAIRHGAASDLHGARMRLQSRVDLLAEGPYSALWAIMDKIIDDYAPVVQSLEAEIEELESSVFTAAIAPSERIYGLRREVAELQRAVRPMLSPLEAIARGTLLGVPERLRPFFRDIWDHLKFASEELASQRELLAVMLQANLAVISLAQADINVRQNETSKQLTVIATIFLPLTFITGFFGMNFDWMVGHIRSFTVFAIYGVGSLFVSLGLLALYFNRRGWLGNHDGDAMVERNGRPPGAVRQGASSQPAGRR